ncbi:MAG: aconitate hydratase [Thermodesulfobacteriota bacterium]
MGRNLIEKLIASHLVSGEMQPGSEISIRIDQTLTQDALGTMAYLQFEAMGVAEVKTKLSVSYVDHLTLQEGFENADDHKYLRTVAAKYGILFSKPGNGICHQLHLERLTRPGWTLLGGDSHTPTAGAVGMLAIGAGGLDVAVAMAGGAFFLIYPKVVRVNLRGGLRPWVTAKDIILELLKTLTTKGNVGTVIEYGGPGTLNLSVPERATITNMGAELGITTSLFPSDGVTRDFFQRQGRADDWAELLPDADARYDRTIDLDLGAIEPNIALPHSPDNVKKIREAGEIPVDQVLIGSCTNSSFKDLMKVAALLKGRKIHTGVSFGVAPGTRQVLRMIAANGALTDIVDAGARILESACGFCVGYGQSPHSGAVSVRTSNRNFEGRSGTKDARVYLVSPESAVAAALTGKITDPRNLGIDYPVIEEPQQYYIEDSMFIPPSGSGEVFRGPNIGDPPRNTAMPHSLKAVVTIKLGDKISTDHIIPAGSVSRFRSNIQKSSAFVFKNLDADFARTCESVKSRGISAVIVAGLSYGQGSSREHAAVCPMYLGVRAVIAKSIERIHMANLINFGIVPLIFEHADDYERIETGDEMEIADPHNDLRKSELILVNRTKQNKFKVRHTLTPRQVEIVLHGGLLNYTGKTQ